MAEPFDFAIIGSGFGGSVAAMRLTEAGYRVAVLEEGLRFRDEDFPKTNWNLRRYLWAPWLRCFGVQAITPLGGLWLLHGKGVGGGSLVYANTLMQPRPAAFLTGAWPRSIDWEVELSPYFAKAKKMLGVTENPTFGAAELELRKLGEALGCADTFHATDVGVYFGERAGVDPYFGGEGPQREPCNACGACMVGCRVGAKNTLVKNYLWFAEKNGAVIRSECKVDRLLPNAAGRGYRIRVQRTRSIFAKPEWIQADKVIVAAGVTGSLTLLSRMKQRGDLPHLSDALGGQVRTNGESLVGATRRVRDVDYSKGIAIGAALHPDSVTKVEAVKYPSGSSAMRLLAVPLTGAGGRLMRPLRLLFQVLKNPCDFLRLLIFGDWARSSVILLVMRSLDEKIDLAWRRGVFGWRLSRASANSLPSYLPLAQEAAVVLAHQMDGIPQNVSPEVLLAAPTTAHILGGCVLGDDEKTSVVNADHEVHGHPGLYVCDGSVIPSNLGVNPSLTIAALAERFASRLVAKGVKVPIARADIDASAPNRRS
ncbi:MAG: GMC family oxidoreductase [Bdellovibrionaceae bacterium]|nr:GMC family oxidoreductase [Pseudobdellovibrionaceae bacterium]